MKKMPFWIFFILSLSTSLLMRSTVLAQANGSSILQLDGQVVSIAKLEINIRGQSLNANNPTGALNFGRVNALGSENNPIGKMLKNNRQDSAYYQASYQIKTQVSGLKTLPRLTVTQLSGGPLQNLVFESDDKIDLQDFEGRSPVPTSPTKAIAIESVPPGQNIFDRQIVIKIPPNLSPGPKQSALIYQLEVGL
ncbi:MAG: hypothetical protein JNK65_02005 [Deltaproteobacteria bacterium]|nr:hypothetical protein [Deltaproteobacteria bacterium]